MSIEPFFYIKIIHTLRASTPITLYNSPISISKQTYKIITQTILQTQLFFYFIFFERQIYYYQVSAQDEQRPINKELHNRGTVYMRTPKQKPS
jgi:hypothetical protein